MKKIWMPAMLGSLMLVLLAASPVFGNFSMGGAEPGGKDNPSPPVYYVVQFEGPIQQEWKDQVTVRGGEFLSYIPYFAFKVRMNPAQARKIEDLESVGAVLPFLPEYKLSPRLAGEGTNLYRVRVERGADAGLVVAAIAKTEAQFLGRQGNMILLAADAAQLKPIAEILDVAWVENFAFHQKYNEGAGGIMGANVANSNGYDGSTQIIAIADTGLGGGTAATAHADIPPGRISAIHSWAFGRDKCLSVSKDGAIDVDLGHGTHVAVSALGDGGPGGIGKGTAPGAKLVFQAVEDYIKFKTTLTCNYPYPDGYYLIGIPYDLRDLYQQAYDDGARIHSNSWGSLGFGEYTIDSGTTDDFIWNNPNMSIVFAAGNDGGDWDPYNGEIDTCDPGNMFALNCWLSSPATAKNVITVGASENQRPNYNCDSGLTGCDGVNTIPSYGDFMGLPHSDFYDDYMADNAEQMAAFSSRGPAFDGRIKPDVVAPGTWVLSGYSDMYQAEYDSSVNPQNGAFQYDGWGLPLNDKYKYMGGTSMAAPLVAGGAAVVRDYYQKDYNHSASAALAKATLINSAVDMLDENNDGFDDNDFPIPNGHEGWGRVNLANATDGSHEFVEETTGLSTTDDSLSYEFYASGDTPFKVSLVWSDYPSTEFVTAIIFGVIMEISPGPNLVNDLDLVVTSPSGVVYTGNNFSDGWAQPGGSADHINNVENVYIEFTEVSSDPWTVTISGFNTPFGPQPYALVVDGVVIADPAPDTKAPTVVVINPNGSDILTVGEAYDITWTATDDVDNVDVIAVDLAYSNDGGTTFQPPFAIGEINDRVYSWTVPDDVRDNAVIKITARDAAGNTGEGMSAVFSIVDSGGEVPAESITITKATYNSKKALLTIEATSSEGGSPTLTAAHLPNGESPVDMSYNSKKGKWSIKISDVLEKPTSVRVCFKGTLNCLEQTEIGGK